MIWCVESKQKLLLLPMLRLSYEWDLSRKEVLLLKLEAENIKFEAGCVSARVVLRVVLLSGAGLYSGMYANPD